MSKKDFKDLAGLFYYRGLYDDTKDIDAEIKVLQKKLIDYEPTEKELNQFGNQVDWEATKKANAPLIAQRKARRKASIEKHNKALEIYSTWDKGNEESIKAYKEARLKAVADGEEETIKYIDDWLKRAESFAEKDIVFDYTAPKETSGSAFSNLNKKSMGDKIARDLLRIAGVAGFRTFVDPIGTALDIAKGNDALAEAMLTYDLKDFGTDVGLSVLTLGLAKFAGPASKMLGKKIAKIASGSGKSALVANMAIKGTQHASRAVQKVSQTIKSAEKQAYDKAGQYIPDSVLQSLKRTPTDLEKRLDTLTDALAKSESKEATEALEMLIKSEQKKLASSGNPLIDWATGKAPQSRKVALEEEYSQASKFAKQSYTDPLKRTDVDDFIYQPNLSTNTEGVWFNPSTNVAHISHRGSTSGTWDDVLQDWVKSDGSIVLGAEDYVERFARGMNKEKQVAQFFPDVTVEGSGHSLGGGVILSNAEEIGTKKWYGKHTTFNGATSAFGKAGIRRKKLSVEAQKIIDGKISNIRHELDPVSFTPAHHGKHITYASKNIKDNINPHSLSVFDKEGHNTINIQDRVKGVVKYVKKTTKETVAKQEFKNLISDDVEDVEVIDRNKYRVDPQYTAVAVDSEQGQNVQIAEYATDDDELILTANDYIQNYVSADEDENVYAQPPMISNNSFQQHSNDDNIVLTAEDYKEYNYTSDKEFVNAIPREKVFLSEVKDFDDENTFHFDDNEQPQKHIKQKSYQQPRIIGYCIYPASLESQYLNKYVEFG